jgi:hypothetical protein
MGLRIDENPWAIKAIRQVIFMPNFRGCFAENLVADKCRTVQVVVFQLLKLG